MNKINCWNEYDSLKTVILGSVFDNDKIPIQFNNQDQENFVKIVEETNLELKNFQTILEQFGVTVLRPKQPLTYNGFILSDQDPLINMRDFHLAYGDIFFLFYGPYKERRFHNLWVEDLVNKLILDDNLILSANEINLDNESKINYDQILDNAQDYIKSMLAVRSILPGKRKNITGKTLDELNYEFAKLITKKNAEKYIKGAGKSFFEWYIEHDCKFKNKNLFHGASLIKYNNRCFMSKFNGNIIGNKWIENWFKKIGVEITYVPYVGHIDGKYAIPNKNTLLVYGQPDKEIVDFFKNILIVEKTIIDVDTDHFYDKPTDWLLKYKKLFVDKTEVNSLSINPETLLLNFYNKEIYDKLKNLGIKAEYVKWTNGPFWEGGLHCITCDIERRQE